MQQRVRQLSYRYIEELKRYYYVTPTSYLVLIKSFTNLLDVKRNFIDSIIRKYTKGLDQLAIAETEVGRLAVELDALIPVLKQKQGEVAAMMVELDKQKKFVAEKTKEVEDEEKVAKAQKLDADNIKADCDAALAKVMPIYNAAIKAVDQLKPADITEVKNFKNPPEAAKAVCETLCIIFDIKPVKKPAASAKEGPTFDYWKPSQEKLLNGQLLNKCKNYPKDNIPRNVIERL